MFIKIQKWYLIEFNHVRSNTEHYTYKSKYYPSRYGVNAGKRDQIDKKIFFEIINVLDQMIKSTSILLRNFFLKKISIWSLFPALTPYYNGYDQMGSFRQSTVLDLLFVPQF